MADVIANVAYDMFVILLPVLAIALAEWLRRLIGEKRLERIRRELETKQELADIAVSFVQQFYNDFEGGEKFLKAKDWLKGMLEERGISFTDNELRALIESSLRAFKDVFGEEWGK